MNHILFQSENPIRSALWELAEKTWTDKKKAWPSISLGRLIACGSLRFLAEPGGRTKSEQRKRDRAANGASRRLQVLLSETSHLIWAIRCERVTQERAHTKTAAENRRWSRINARLRTDRAAALKIQKNPRGIMRMSDTWAPIVDKHGCNFV
jgi:hypothetical protein